MICDAAVALIKRNEGCVLHAYPDPATGGEPWTAGYGHTGAEVTPGLVITQDDAEAWLIADLARFEAGVREAVGDAPTTANQLGAMVSLAYNIGLGNFARSSVLRDHIGGRAIAETHDFEMWDMAAGRPFPALLRRRDEEAALYMTPDDAGTAITAAAPWLDEKAVQQRLADLGYYQGQIDGIAGRYTLLAVEAFQRALGLDIDGIVGPKTWAALAT